MNELPSQTEFRIRERAALGPGARDYRLSCRHGSSSALLLPGQKPFNDLAILDLLLASHHHAKDCGCQPAIPMPTTPARA